jgi:polycomb protein SUZ12
MKMKMAPKRDNSKNGYKSKEDRSEQTQADHELFLQAFEKPTQIYRYLRTRNLISPIFLNRTLTFMKKRMSRSNEARKTFKIDSLLERRVKEDSDLSVTNLGGYMTMTFLGYYDKDANPREEKVRLELLLVKLSHKKRKESASPVVQVNLGTSEVPINPSEVNPPSKAPALSIPSKSFSLAGFGGVGRVKTYSLLIRLFPGETSDSENTEPVTKRVRREEEELRTEEVGDVGRVVTAELVVYDKHSRCLLTEGEYELVMTDSDGKSKISPKKNASWEIIDVDPTSTNPSDHQFQVFSHNYLQEIYFQEPQ